MKGFADIKSPSIKLLESDVDTDQIIPARFLRTSTSEGLGSYLFFDRRYKSPGLEFDDFPLNSKHYDGETILIAGSNFGCGSSREHAPWALKDFGFKAIIARSFADIFYNNCLLNGLLPIIVDEHCFQRLIQNSSILRISLREQILAAETWQVSFKIDPFARYCLLHGLSELDYLTGSEDAIANFEATHKTRFHSTKGLQGTL